MALTFETLFDRSASTLSQANRKLEVLETDKPTKRVEQQTSATQLRINELVSEYATFAELASTQNQRTSYGAEDGAEKWHEDFVMLRELQLPEHSRFRTAQEFRDYVWSRVPNGAFKRFQEIFTRPEHLSVPRFETDEKGNVHFHSTDFETIGLKGCLVGADKIPDGLAEDLGLCDFSENDGDPVERLRKKHEAIPRLKKIWESARPLQERNHRLLVIEEPSDEVEATYPNIEGPGKETLGTILYVREKESTPDPVRRGAPRRPRALTAQHFDDAYSALRKPAHVSEQYRQELANITEMSVALEDLNLRLNAGWSDVQQRDALREEAATLSDRCLSVLANAKNIYKVEARTFVDKFRELKDARGRDNPSAAMSQMIAAIKRLERRYRDMEPKGGFNQRDEMVLEKQVAMHEERFAGYRRAVVGSARVTGNGLELFDGNKPMTDNQLNMNVIGLKKRLGLNPAEKLAPVTLQPFRAYRGAMTEAYKGLETSLAERDREAAMDQTIKLHVIGKYQQLRKMVEELKALTMNPLVAFGDMRVIVTRMIQVFNDRQVFPDRVVTGIEAPFTAMTGALEAIERRLREYEGMQIDLDTRRDIHAKMKQYLDTFDIEELAIMSQ